MGGCASKRKDVDGEAPGAPQGNLPVTPDAVEAIEVRRSGCSALDSVVSSRSIRL